MTRCGQPRELPASIDLSAYRIVQEALTNVVKHARTSSCRVLIGYGHDELVLEVTDNGAGLPAMAGAGISQHHGSTLALAGGGGFAGDAGRGAGGPDAARHERHARLARAGAFPERRRSAGFAIGGAGTASSGCASG